MSIFNEAKLKLTRKASRMILKGRKHSPEILIGTGIILGVASCVTACKATLKADEVLDDIQKDINTIKEAGEKADEETYSDKDISKDLTIAYGKGAVKFAKLYWKPTALGVAAIVCILSGHNILRKRNLALVALNAGLEAKYNTLYSRVSEEFSKEAADKFANGIRSTEIEEVDNKGKVKKRNIDLIDPNNKLGPYEYIIGPEHPIWTPDLNYSLMTLRNYEKWANDQLIIRGHLALSDLLPQIDINVTRDDYVTGWILPTDYYATTCARYIKFDTMRVWEKDEGGNPIEVILLKLNCDGYIWDKIDRYVGVKGCK